MTIIDADARLAEVRSVLARGGDLRDAAKSLGINYASLLAWIAKHAPELSPRGPQPMTRTEIEIAVETMASAGKSDRQIEAELGVTKRAVRHARRRLGIAAKSLVDHDKRAAVARMVQAGEKNAAIVATLRCGKRMIAEVRRELNGGDDANRT